MGDIGKRPSTDWTIMTSITRKIDDIIQEYGSWENFQSSLNKDKMGQIQTDIIEGNKLIADFNDYLERAEKEKSPYLYAMKHAYEHGNLKYHESWDWLMPVVEKISEMHIDRYIPRIEIVANRYVTLNSPNQPLTTFSVAKHGLITATWQAVVAFIQWYNQQSVREVTVQTTKPE